MKVITIVDEKNGLTFCNKRLSRDSKLYKYIDNLFDRYTITKFSEGLPLMNATLMLTSTYFIEDSTINLISEELMKDISEFYIFNWNRHYPSTEKFKLNLHDYNIKYIDEFVGSSHEKITLTVYERVKNEEEKEN